MTGRTTRELEAGVLAELVEALKAYEHSHTEAVSHLRGLSTNNVLETALITLEADGHAVRQYQVPFGSVAIANHDDTGQGLIVVAGPLQAQAPGGGRGMGQVVGGKAAMFNLVGTILSFYGVAGKRLSIQVFSKPQPPAWGPA